MVSIYDNSKYTQIFPSYGGVKGEINNKYPAEYGVNPADLYANLPIAYLRFSNKKSKKSKKSKSKKNKKSKSKKSKK